MNSVVSYHLPGHSPDALVFLLGEEVLLAGDTLLPDLSPHPTRPCYFDQVANVFAPEYPHGDSIYGLRAYIRSLKKLEKIGTRMDQLVVLPAMAGVVEPHNLLSMSAGFIRLVRLPMK